MSISEQIFALTIYLFSIYPAYKEMRTLLRRNAVHEDVFDFILPAFYALLPYVNSIFAVIYVVHRNK